GAGELIGRDMPAAGRGELDRGTQRIVGAGCQSHEGHYARSPSLFWHWHPAPLLSRPLATPDPTAQPGPDHPRQAGRALALSRLARDACCRSAAKNVHATTGYVPI